MATKKAAKKTVKYVIRKIRKTTKKTSFAIAPAIQAHITDLLAQQQAIAEQITGAKRALKVFKG